MFPNSNTKCPKSFRNPGFLRPSENFFCDSKIFLWQRTPWLGLAWCNQKNSTYFLAYNFPDAVTKLFESFFPQLHLKSEFSTTIPFKQKSLVMEETKEYL